MTNAELAAAVKKNPVMVACVALSVALALTIYFRSGALQDENTVLDEKSAQARKYALNISNAVELKEHVDTLTAANKAIDERMIRASNIGINQQYFYKLESESGVKLLDLKQGAQAATKGSYAPVSFTVSLQGDFNQVLAFLRGLEDGTRFSRVMTASCGTSRTNAGMLTLSLTIELLGRP